MKRYYDKITHNMVFEPSDTTIPWESLPQDFLDYANNLQDKSYEVSYDEEGMPIIKRLELDEEGNRYSHYLENGKPDLVAIEEELRTKFENEFRQSRDNLLSTVVDHYQKPLVWESLTVEQQNKVRTYRQALLDSTTNWILPEELVI